MGEEKDLDSPPYVFVLDVRANLRANAAWDYSFIEPCPGDPSSESILHGGGRHEGEPRYVMSPC